jgi:predicted cobalt transporter CbtA
MRAIRIVAAIVGALAAAGTLASAREVQSLQPLLLEAMEYGDAEGVIVGPIAQTFADLFKTTAPLRFSVKTVRDLSPDCRRLQVTATQDEVWDRNSKIVATAPASQRVTYQVSMCKDGTYPPANGASK